jgi:peroxiredoxin Q/BCP
VIPAVGKPAPEFTAKTDADQVLELSSVRGKIVVLFFYPKDDTSG